MYHTEYRVTVRNGVNDNSDCEKVVKFVDCLVLRVHFSENTVKMFCTSRNLTFNIHLVKFFTKYVHNVAYVLFAFVLFLIYALTNFFVCDRVKVL